VFTTTVSAPTPQILGITNNVCSSWSDGGAQTHTVTAATDSTYTAIHQSTQRPCPENEMKHAYPDCPTSGPTTADVDRYSLGSNVVSMADRTDIHPGRFLPVTAHHVEAPTALRELAPRVVIITNPAYRSEIAAHIERLGVAADLMVA